MDDRSTLWTWLLLVLGPVLAVALTNTGLAHARPYWELLLRLPEGSPHRTDALLWQQPEPSVAIIGSSVAVHGLSAPILSAQLSGAPVVNLGQNGASVLTTAMLLPELRDAAPEQVVLMLSPLELRADQDPDWQRHYSPTIAAAVFSLPEVLRQPAPHLSGMASRASVLYRHRDGLRAALTRNMAKAGGLEHPQGFDAYLAWARAELAALDLHRPGPNHTALRALAAGLSASGSALIICPAPLHPSLQPEGFSRPLHAALDIMAAETDFVVLNPRRLGRYTADDFQDPLHLTSGGQRRLTAAVARQLRAL